MEKFSFGGDAPPNNKKDKKISRRDFLKIGAKAGAAAAVLGVGAFSGGCDDGNNITKEEVMKKHSEDRRAGYADLNHFLDDYPEVKDNQEELEEARRYFKEQDRKGGHANNSVSPEEVMKTHSEDRRAGYADLEHFLEDYPEIRGDQEKLKDVMRYFKGREK